MAQENLHCSNDRSGTKQHVCTSKDIIHQTKNHKHHMSNTSFQIISFRHNQPVFSSYHIEFWQLQAKYAPQESSSYRKFPAVQRTQSSDCSLLQTRMAQRHHSRSPQMMIPVEMLTKAKTAIVSQRCLERVDQNWPKSQRRQWGLFELSGLPW